MNEQGLPSNDVAGVRNYLSKKLNATVGEREANAIVSILFEFFLGWNKSELALKAKERISESEILKLHMAVKEIALGKPVQHITGYTHFYGNTFRVNRHVLIPRPETEELVDRIIKSKHPAKPIILDVGTGSGCIAISLKKNIPDAKVFALDVSTEALKVAEENAKNLSAEITFLCDDVLHSSWNQPVDILVSNPPYIPLREASMLDKNVIEHEPHTALFVPDEDPLLFYKSLLRFSEKFIRPGGFVALECHEFYAEEVANLYRHSAAKNVRIEKDFQGKNRMLFADFGS